VDIEAKAARDLFARPAFAASSESTRYYLNGIFLHSVGDDLVAVATDGYRSAASRRRQPPHSRPIAP
jgi:DNA polymerase-3 subunit beta